MRNIQQHIFGNNNTQNIFTEADKSPIDILPQDIEFILDVVNKNSSEIFDKMPIIIPDLSKKNKLNGIDKNQFNIILDDVPYFDDIETSLRKDESGILKNKYYCAAKILNIQYMNKFQKDFPNFIVKVAKGFSELNSFDNSKILKLLIMMHYMYHECDLGIRP